MAGTVEEPAVSVIVAVANACKMCLPAAFISEAHYGPSQFEDASAIPSDRHSTQHSDRRRGHRLHPSLRIMKDSSRYAPQELSLALSI